jgi:hypothetical protein
MVVVFSAAIAAVFLVAGFTARKIWRRNRAGQRAKAALRRLQEVV